MPYQPTRKTLKQATTATSEREDLGQDASAVTLGQDLDLKFQWERDVLEECSERVYRKARALLPRQRDALHEILERYQGKAAE